MIQNKDIIQYEIDKKQFYKKRSQSIGAIISDDFCEYEEKKYGDKLSLIYKKISENNTGKKHIISLIKYILLITIVYFVLLLNKTKSDYTYINTIIYLIATLIGLKYYLVNKKVLTYISFVIEKKTYELKNKETL